MRQLVESAERQKLKAIGQRIKKHQQTNSSSKDNDFHREHLTMTTSKNEATEKQNERNKSHVAAASLERVPKMGNGGGQRRQNAER